MFTYDEGAQVLDVDREWIRSQVTVKTGLCYNQKRLRGAGLSSDELLALGVLKSVQRIVGKNSPAAQAIVKGYRPFLAGVLASPGRSIPDVMIPLAEGDHRVEVQLQLPWLPEWLRRRMALLRSGQPLPRTESVLEVQGVVEREVAR